jgi:hypothetical protein
LLRELGWQCFLGALPLVAAGRENLGHLLFGDIIILGAARRH